MEEPSEVRLILVFGSVRDAGRDIFPNGGGKFGEGCGGWGLCGERLCHVLIQFLMVTKCTLVYTRNQAQARNSRNTPSSISQLLKSFTLQRLPAFYTLQSQVTISTAWRNPCQTQTRNQQTHPPENLCQLLYLKKPALLISLGHGRTGKPTGLPPVERLCVTAVAYWSIP